MKKNYIYLLALTFVFSIYAQELEEEFLETLPDDVKEDLLDKADAKKELEKPVYRKASTELDKDLETDEDDDDVVEVFGKKFFDTIQSTFMPINEPNLDGSYILDYGDVLDVQVVGQRNFIETYPVKRDGSVNIPDIGKIVVSGLSLSDASSIIKL